MWSFNFSFRFWVVTTLWWEKYNTWMATGSNFSTLTKSVNFSGYALIFWKYHHQNIHTHTLLQFLDNDTLSHKRSRSMSFRKFPKTTWIIMSSTFQKNPRWWHIIETNKRTYSMKFKLNSTSSLKDILHASNKSCLNNDVMCQKLV